MPYRIHTYFFADHLVDDPIIADAEFSVAFEPAAKRISKSEGIGKKSLLNGPTNPLLDIPVDPAKIPGRNIRMVEKSVRHWTRIYPFQTWWCDRAFEGSKL